MKKLKLSSLNKDRMDKRQMNSLRGGDGSIGGGTSGCEGCLCDSTVSGQSSTNNSKARDSSGAPLD